MNRTFNFCKRNIKEMLRDPVIYIFCLGFPVAMMLLFNILNKYTGNHTPMFKMRALLPAVIMFSYTFVMLTTSLLVSKDRQTFFLKRLYSSPMKSHDFALGYAIVGLGVGLAQTVICVLTGFILCAVSGEDFISFGQILLVALSQLPILIAFVFFGVFFGTVLNDKSAPGICSILISAAGILGGCWMPIESMGGFETFARFLPFYPSVYIGRAITKGVSATGTVYTFDNVALLGIIPIAVFTLASVVLSFIFFKKDMVSDK